MPIAVHMAKLLEEAVRESNCIEREPPGGASFDRHLRSARAAIASVDDGKLIDPLALHRLAYDGFYDHGGRYRDVDVYIKSTNHGLILFPPPEEVPALMQKWWAQLDKMTPWEAHASFENIHPFEDGNGRIGRCMLWALEYRAGEPISIIRCADRFAYYARLQESRSAEVSVCP